MKRILFLLSLIFSMNSIVAQNVGIGTTAPKSRLSVGSNSQFQIDGLGDIRRINDIPYSFPVIQGSSGQFLMNDGTGQLNWTSIIQGTASMPDSIIKVTPANYLTVVVPQENFVKINGEITITDSYNSLNRDKLIVTGGSFVGSGTSILNIGIHTIFNGTKFSNISLTGNYPMFINCTFEGNCPNLGLEGRFYNCTFLNVQVNPLNRVGTLQTCIVSNCNIPRIISLIDCEITNSTIGNGSFVNNITSCNIRSSSIYALLSTFMFNGNICDNTRIIIGNSQNCASSVQISNNEFDNLLSGSSEVIQVDPSSTSLKFLNISDNLFTLSTGEQRSISVIANEGSPTRSVLSIQGNTFYRGNSILSYTSNMKAIYSQNIQSFTSHPTATGALIVSNNF